MLAVIVGVASTLLGLVLALVVQRGGQRFTGVLRVMFDPADHHAALRHRPGVVVLCRTHRADHDVLEHLGVPRSRWIYGLPGVTIAQLLTFTPIAFMILHGALGAISPALEEAAQTLRASRGRVFRTVTWPLLRPALAAAFLLGFVESLADFGNPIVLAGNYDVLSTKIFFAITGAQHDPGRAAVLASVLLALTLLAFWLQQRWLGRASYVTVSERAWRHARATAARLWLVCFWIARPDRVHDRLLPLILTGGFVKDIGRGDMALTLHHFGAGSASTGGARVAVDRLSVEQSFNTVQVAAVAAPLTALVASWPLTSSRAISSSDAAPSSS